MVWVGALGGGFGGILRKRKKKKKKAHVTNEGRGPQRGAD